MYARIGERAVTKASPAVAALTIWAAAIGFSQTAFAQSGGEFYHGKTIRIVFGSPVGGSYGIYSQLVAQHLGKFIPGSPNIIIESRPGAGGLVALNYLGAAAPRDGTVITLVHATIAQEGMFNPAAQFDPVQFRFIGRFGSLEQIGMASKKSGIRKLEDARKRDVIVGAVGSADVTSQLPQAMNRLAGTRFKVITGYPGTSQTYLALERGEVELAATSLDTVRANHWDQYKSGELVPIMAYGRARLPDFPDVPTVVEFGKTEVDKSFLRIFMLASDIGRSLAAPPGVPTERVAALRAAYAKMVVDPTFMADAIKLRLSLAPMPGSELDKLVSEATNIAPKLRHEAQAFYEGLSQGLTKRSAK
jgi:tripartite-type tricarboxylate transporter receptor subunit TctC